MYFGFIGRFGKSAKSKATLTPSVNRFGLTPPSRREAFVRKPTDEGWSGAFRKKAPDEGRRGGLSLESIPTRDGEEAFVRKQSMKNSGEAF